MSGWSYLTVEPIQRTIILFQPVISSQIFSVGVVYEDETIWRVCWCAPGLYFPKDVVKVGTSSDAHVITFRLISG